MRIIRTSSRFKKSFKKISKHKSFKQEKFDYVLLLLSTDIQLPTNFKDHELKGNLKNKRECHISPDILLIYEIDKEIIYLDLLDIGTHSHLF